MNKILFKMAIARSGYTQNQLAKELGISRNALSNKINGRSSVTVSDVIRICEILNIQDNNEKAEIFLSSISQ